MLRSHHHVHPWRRRVGLIALAVTILGLYVLASLRPSEAAAAIERAVQRWIGDADAD